MSNVVSRMVAGIREAVRDYGPQPKKLFRVTAVRRSGHHAVMQWIAAQVSEAGGKYLFMNDVRPFTSPMQSARMGPPPYDSNMSAWSLLSERCGIPTPKELVIYNFEDTSLDEIYASQEDRQNFGKEADANILILRDPFNLFASRIRGFDQWLKNPISGVYVAMWKEQAREFVSLTDYLSRKITINFNRWCVDRDYRQSIAGRLGIEFSDAKFDQTPSQGQGSSFQDDPSAGYGPQRRFLHMHEHGAYRDLFRNDPELIDLSERIFGPIPGTAQLFG